MPDLSAWNAADWEAFGTCVTAVVALAAGGIAWRQVKEARRLRVEQSQPYVAVFMDSSAINPQFVDLVVKNFGMTVALEVKLRVTPSVQRSTQEGGVQDVWLPDTIPTLVPGQEWRTWWDFSVDRARGDLPDRYTAQVNYSGSTRRRLIREKLSGTFVLDWGQFKERRWMQERGIHDAANALREINKRLKKWDAGINKGLRVSLRGDSGQGVPPDEQRL